MNSTSYLTIVPVEILQVIIEHTYASGHWPLAQTCRHIYFHSQPILDCHRRAYQNFRISSDLNPFTVPSLLWSTFSEGAASINAWHVREFEVWGDRLNGEPWEVDVDAGEVQVLEESEPWEVDAEAGGVQVFKPWSFSDNDIDYFCDKLFKVPDFFAKANSGNYQDQARAELENGSDILLKSFLLAHLPRIKALRYARSGKTEHLSFKYLCRMIYWCEAAGRLLPGLKALQKVSVGITLARLDAAPGILRPYERSGQELGALLCLPNLSEVYIAHLDGTFDFDDDVKNLFLFGLQHPFNDSSPVRTIILDMIEGMSDKLINFIAKTPRRLQNLAIRSYQDGWVMDDDLRQRLAYKLSKYQRPSLQRFCWYNVDADETRAYNYMNPIQVARFEDLRVVSLDPLYTEGDLHPGDDSRSERKAQFAELLRSHLPIQVEIVDFDAIDIYGYNYQTAEVSKNKTAYLDGAVEAMIKSERYKNLKAVFLENIQDVLSMMEMSLVHFPRALKAAEERGIYVHLKGSNPPPGIIINGEFIPMPTRDCMITGRFVPEVRQHSRPSGYEECTGQARK